MSIVALNVPNVFFDDAEQTKTFPAKTKLTSKRFDDVKRQADRSSSALFLRSNMNPLARRKDITMTFSLNMYHVSLFTDVIASDSFCHRLSSSEQ